MHLPILFSFFYIDTLSYHFLFRSVDQPANQPAQNDSLILAKNSLLIEPWNARRQHRSNQLPDGLSVAA